jgi:hypothetical protein
MVLEKVAEVRCGGMGAKEAMELLSEHKARPLRLEFSAGKALPAPATETASATGTAAPEDVSVGVAAGYGGDPPPPQPDPTDAKEGGTCAGGGGGDGAPLVLLFTEAGPPVRAACRLLHGRQVACFHWNFRRTGSCSARVLA